MLNFEVFLTGLPRIGLAIMTLISGSEASRVRPAGGEGFPVDLESQLQEDLFYLDYIHY